MSIYARRDNGGMMEVVKLLKNRKSKDGLMLLPLSVIKRGAPPVTNVIFETDKAICFLGGYIAIKDQSNNQRPVSPTARTNGVWFPKSMLTKCKYRFCKDGDLKDAYLVEKWLVVKKRKEGMYLDYDRFGYEIDVEAFIDEKELIRKIS